MLKKKQTEKSPGDFRGRYGSWQFFLKEAGFMLFF